MSRRPDGSFVRSTSNFCGVDKGEVISGSSYEQVEARCKLLSILKDRRPVLRINAAKSEQIKAQPRPFLRPRLMMLSAKAAIGSFLSVRN